MNRPDFSEYVVHFTKDGQLFAGDDEDAAVRDQIQAMSAEQRLTAILSGGSIRATPMPWTGRRAVAFTECTWRSLLAHAHHYSMFGVGFGKAHLFAAGGGPAIYMPPGLFQHQRDHAAGGTPFHPQVYSFITPFCPSYAPREYRERFWSGKAPVDYTHEREWRVPHDFQFRLEDVKFVVVGAYEDMARAPRELKDAIGRRRWLIMENYETIERIWPMYIAETEG